MIPKIFITLQEKQCRALSFPKTINFRFMLVISVHERAGQTTVGDLEKMTQRQTNVNYFSFFPGSVSPIVSFCSGHPLSWEKVMFKQRMAVTSFSPDCGRAGYSEVLPVLVVATRQLFHGPFLRHHGHQLMISIHTTVLYLDNRILNTIVCKCKIMVSLFDYMPKMFIFFYQ